MKSATPQVILGMDTSSQAASCALLRDGTLVGEFFIHTALTHSQTMLPMVQSLLDRTGTALRDVDLFAVSTGPGSFTGLRIGISAVKGMALPGNTPCAAVSTLEGLGENLRLFPGLVVPVMDARREQVYTAGFDNTDGAMVRLWEDAAISLAELRERLEARKDKPVLLVGDGAALCKRAVEDLSWVSVAPETLLHQRAGSVASVAFRMAPEEYLPPGKLSPRYLRLPQAERERLAQMARPKTPRNQSEQEEQP